jgi:type I restriction enzyme, S subunit
VSESWSTKLLGDVTTLQRGFDLPQRLRTPGVVPIITSSGFEDTHNEARVAAPGVVTGRYGTIGGVFFVREDFWPLNTTLYVRDFHENDPLFIFYLLATIDFASHSGKSGVPGVNRNDLHKLQVSVPPTKAEQEAIAEALSDADSLIESLEQLIAKKRQIKQGAMQELLTGKQRLPGFSGEWEVKTFGEVFAYLPTATNSRNDLSEDGEAYYIHYGDIHTKFHNHLDFAATAPPMIEMGRCRNAALIKNGDWVMADASEDYDGVGKTIEITGLEEGQKAVAGLHTFLLREYSPIFVPGFKRHLGGLKSLHEEYLRVATGMKVYGVSKTALVDLELPVPHPGEQTAIAEILSDMDAEIAALDSKLAKARQLKQGMVQELLTGQIRLIQLEASHA